MCAFVELKPSKGGIWFGFCEKYNLLSIWGLPCRFQYVVTDWTVFNLGGRVTIDFIFILIFIPKDLKYSVYFSTIYWSSVGSLTKRVTLKRIGDNMSPWTTPYLSWKVSPRYLPLLMKVNILFQYSSMIPFRLSPITYCFINNKFSLDIDSYYSWMSKSSI